MSSFEEYRRDLSMTFGRRSIYTGEGRECARCTAGSSGRMCVASLMFLASFDG